MFILITQLILIIQLFCVPKGPSAASCSAGWQHSLRNLSSAKQLQRRRIRCWKWIRWCVIRTLTFEAAQRVNYYCLVHFAVIHFLINSCLIDFGVIYWCLYTAPVIKTEEGVGLCGVAFSPSVANPVALCGWDGCKLINIRHPNQY